MFGLFPIDWTEVGFYLYGVVVGFIGGYAFCYEKVNTQ